MTIFDPAGPFGKAYFNTQDCPHCNQGELSPSADGRTDCGFCFDLLDLIMNPPTEEDMGLTSTTITECKARDFEIGDRIMNLAAQHGWQQNWDGCKVISVGPISPLGSLNVGLELNDGDVAAIYFPADTVWDVSKAAR